MKTSASAISWRSFFEREIDEERRPHHMHGAFLADTMCLGSVGKDRTWAASIWD
jgi:hypothetical protein